MPRPQPSRPSKLTAEERRLAKQQEELRRREEELQRTLKMIPAKLEERKAREKKLAKLRAEASAPAISLAGGRSLRSGRTSTKPRRTPARELQNARIKFLVLCLIFASLVILLLKQLPS